MSNEPQVKLKPNDFIYTPDEEAFNKAVEAFVAAGANLDAKWCSWSGHQHEFGIVWFYDNDLLDCVTPRDSVNLVSLDDL